MGQISPINPVFVEGMFTDQITVATAGTSVQGPNVPAPTGVVVQALNANTGTIYVWWQTGDGRTHGWELNANNKMFFPVNNVNKLWFDASANTQKACWLIW